MPVIDEIWAVERNRAENFFESADLMGCTVKIVSLDARSLGSLTIPQTEIIISGKESTALFQKFKTCFMSAGG